VKPKSLYRCFAGVFVVQVLFPKALQVVAAIVDWAMAALCQVHVVKSLQPSSLLQEISLLVLQNTHRESLVHALH